MQKLITPFFCAGLLFASAGCGRKTQSFAENQVNFGPPQFSGTRAEKVTDSDNLRSTCLGMPAYAAEPLLDESEVSEKTLSEKVRGLYSVSEIRYYSEILTGGIQVSAAGSNTSIEGLANENVRKNTRVLCDTAPGSTAGVAVSTFPSLFNQVDATPMSVRNVVSIRHVVQRGRYSASVATRTPQTTEAIGFKFLGESTEGADQFAARLFLGNQGRLRLRYRQIRVLNKEKNIHLRLDAEVFYEKQ